MSPLRQFCLVCTLIGLSLGLGVPAADVAASRSPIIIAPTPPVVIIIGDNDLDGLSNGDEYTHGTNRDNSDTDGGGENDGSEVGHGQDPLDPSDDEIQAPERFSAEAQNGAVTLRYDVKTEYVSMRLWRSVYGAGVWYLRTTELSLTGREEHPAVNEVTYQYRIMATDGDDHRSAVLESDPATPSEDWRQVTFLPVALR